MSAQRESDPHFRHGKAAGYRYIMGAWLEAELSKIHTVRIKSPPCCLLHHDPQRRSGVCVSIAAAATWRAPVFLFPVVATNPASMPIGARIELSTTRVSAVSGPPALDYRSKSGTPESNPHATSPNEKSPASW